MRAVVIVLGDLGRSPRMQYHARALAQHGVDVDLLGEEGAPLPAFLDDPRIIVHRLPSRRPSASGRAAFLVRAAVASARSALDLWRGLRRCPRPDVILIQTPPAIPSLAIAWLAARVHRTRLVFDWHNLGWTVLALRLPQSNITVRLARALERGSSGLADAHLAVSSAMAAHLAREWKLRSVHVFRDRAAEPFTPAAADAAIRERIMRDAGLEQGQSAALVVSPTSWTRDEDMDLLLDASDRLDEAWSREPGARRLLLVLTGQGPGRQAFEARLARRAARAVFVATAWLEPDDYPRLVAAADAGICVHRSSSGLDLPMKVCDMLGAAIPVCMLDYGPTVGEAVTEGRDALLFRDANELAAGLDRLFGSWPARSPLWSQLREGALAASAGPRWIDAWASEAKSALLPP